MFKSLALAAVMTIAAAVPASAVTVSISQSADTTNIPFVQTNQTFNIGSAAGVASAVLNITTLVADDLVVVSLNGTPLVGSGIFGPGNGNVFFTAGGPSTPFTFAYGNGPINANFTSPFVLGDNVLTITYNNNNAGINVGNGGLTGGPGTYTVEGTATFVPEPATWGLLLVGFAMTGAAMRRRSTHTVAA